MASEKKFTVTRRSVLRRFGLKREVLDRLENLQIVIPVCREGRERAYGEEEIDHLRVYCLLLRELEVNEAGAEIILRMRRQIIDIRRRLALFLGEVQSRGLLEELDEIFNDLD